MPDDNPYPVDSTTRTCCGGIGSHTRQCPTDPGLPPGAIEAGEWDDLGHPGAFRQFRGAKRVVTWRDAEGGQPEQAELYINGVQLTDGSIDVPRHIRVTGIGWEDAIPADGARELARVFSELADEIDGLA